MKFFFWQNSNSIHQSAFFNALAANPLHEVTLLVQDELREQRKNMGWKVPELRRVRVLYLKKIDFNWHDLIDQNVSSDCLHIFSGISAYEFVHRALKYAIKNNCRVGIFSEPVDLRGFKGKVRLIRGFIHKAIYNSKIELILGTGDLGKNQFERWGFGRNKIFEWAYTVEKSTNEINLGNKGVASDFKIMFAGSLIHRKGYDILIDALKLVDKRFVAHFYCLGNGAEELAQTIKDGSELKDKLMLYPFLSNQALRQKMNEYDLFILPSRHDGWGAVISESIMEGTPVLVSKFCGSASLLKSSGLAGHIIDPLEAFNLSTLLLTAMKSGQVTPERRLSIRNWATQNMAGDAMADYFIAIIKFINRESDHKPSAPWAK